MTFRRTTPAWTAGAGMIIALIGMISCSTATKSQNLNLALLSVGKVPSAPQIIDALIPKGTYGRHKMLAMEPGYITIHSTQNYSLEANAAAHARLLQRGGLTSRHNSLGYLTWHFTVDDKSIYQSLPTTEQGQHADYEGIGNKTSIGIEMCENSDNSRERTLEQTAKLTAWLMVTHNIPLSNIVPHQHWQRIRTSDGRNLGHKNCPRFLMDDGKPGAKWQGFLDRVKSYL